MRWGVLIIAAFLLAGAVVNVAVAWGCAVNVRYRWMSETGSTLRVERHDALFKRLAPSDWPSPKLLVGLGRNFGYEQCQVPSVRWPTENNYWVGVVWQKRAGWPAYTLLSEGWKDQITGAGGSSIEFRGLPLCPIWPGFALNTFFYAVVLWLVYYGLLAMRRLIRRRRGLRPKCAYPVGESAVCTECGKELAT